MIAWHVVNTKPSQEIRASIELAKQGFEVYLPLLNAPKAKSQPLFPRYIFSAFDRDVDNWGLIRSTRGCCDVLKNGPNPATVRQPIIDAIKAYAASEPSPEPVRVFALGEIVKIQSGLLQGYQALFKGTNKQRTMALMEFMGVPWTIPLSDLAATA